MPSVASLRAITVVLLALTSYHCQDQSGLLVPDRGLPPLADARVEGHEGKLVMLEYTGEPITLALDASQSRDPDGRITRFQWLSGTRAPAAGSGAAGPAPEWPEDTEKPEVTLGEGSHAFSLWVVDNQGLVSMPDVVRVVVASTP